LHPFFGLPLSQQSIFQKEANSFPYYLPFVKKIVKKPFQFQKNNVNYLQNIETELFPGKSFSRQETEQ